MGNQDPHWNLKAQVRLLKRCWLVLLHAGSIVEVALELVGNCHVQQVIGLKNIGVNGGMFRFGTMAIYFVKQK